MKNGLASVAGCGSDFLHPHRDPDGGWLPYLNQRVRDVHIGGEDRGPQRTRGVNRIGGGGIDAFDMMPRTENRDACRIGFDFNDLLPAGEIPCHPGMDFDFPGQTGVERQLQLAGHDLLDHDLTRMANLLGGQLEGPCPGIDSGQVNLGLNLVRPQLPDGTLRAANADLRFGNGLGAELEVRRHVLEHDGGAHGNFGGLLVARNQEPEPGGQCERQQFQSQVVQHVTLDEPDHSRGSPAGPGPDFRCGAGSARGDSNLAPFSSSTPCAMGVGSETGVMWRRSSLPRRSRSCSTVKSRSILPPTAKLMAPVSSEQMTAMASVSSVIPIPARWRVPSCVDSNGFIERGRKQAAAAMRSFCTITAPSCRGALGRNMVASRS